jgi:hypothetical protein
VDKNLPVAVKKWSHKDADSNHIVFAAHENFVYNLKNDISYSCRWKYNPGSPNTMLDIRKPITNI